jgi:hypothetical protein
VRDHHATNGHAPPPSPVTLSIDSEALKPLVAEIVRQVLAELASVRDALPEGPLAFTEEQAAEMLGLHPWQLRDARLRGEIHASAITGRRIRYRREDLENYLNSRPWIGKK